MPSLEVSLPADLTAFVEQQASAHGYGSSGDVIRQLIRRERDRQVLRASVLDGAASPVVGGIEDVLVSLCAATDEEEKRSQD